MNLLRLQKEKINNKIKALKNSKNNGSEKQIENQNKKIEKIDKEYDRLQKEYMSKYSQFSKDDGCGTHVYDRKLEPKK